MRRKCLSLFFCVFLLIVLFFPTVHFYANAKLKLQSYSVNTSSSNDLDLKQEDNISNTGIPLTTSSAIDIPEEKTTPEPQLPEVVPQKVIPPDTTPPFIVPPKEQLPKVVPQKAFPPNTIPPFIVLPKPIKNAPASSTKDSGNTSTGKNTLETFINSKNFKSTSNYLIWINTNTQRTYIFSKSKATWKISKTFLCATGKDSTPTIKGLFKSLSKASWVFDRKYNCYLKNVTQIYKGYLLHSVILNKSGGIIDGTLGKKKSHGCIRLSIKDSEWIYKNLPLGTTIFIN